jgi:ABC-type Zn uptake system ZnuABC Zn-binding protein ZnuA
LNEATLVFQNGFDYEPFLDDFFSKKNDVQKLVVMSEGVTPIPIPNTLNVKDPHAWMSIYNVLFYIHNIKKTLCKVDAANAFFYEKNYDVYRAKLVKLEEELFQSLNTLPMNQRVLIDEHKGLWYFARAYNLHYITLNGVDGVEEKSALKRIRKTIREDSVEVIFTEKKINNTTFIDLAKGLNAELGETLYADSVGDTESGVLTYTDMLRHNTDAIFKGLSKKNMDVSKVSWWEDRINGKTFSLILLIIAAIAAFFWYREKKIQ